MNGVCRRKNDLALSHLDSNSCITSFSSLPSLPHLCGPDLYLVDASHLMSPIHPSSIWLFLSLVGRFACLALTFALILASM